MTLCTRHVRRRTGATVCSRGRRKDVVIEIEPGGHYITFRLAGERRRFSLPTAFLYTEAVRQHVQSERERRKTERKARRRK